MVSALPTPPQYQEAIQNPRVSFGDPELQSCQVETDPMMGLPRARSGGFAITYKLLKPGKQIAVRCFHKSVPDREERYQAVSKFLKQQASSIFIPITYLKNGIRFQGQWYPITYMPWVDGDTLITFLDKNYQNQQLVSLLAKEFEQVVGELSSLNIAHGDLSGANIIIKNNKMVLIDYDGMFVPDLKGYQSNEVGNLNFQHPRRTSRHFDSKLDRFSSFVIYLSLIALSRNPSLWTKFGTGEGLLFGRKDFDNPYGSVILKEMEAFTELKPLVNLFRQVCQSDYSSIPSFNDFLANKTFVPLPSAPTPVSIPTYVPQYPVYMGTATRTILQQEGDMVEIVGKIVEVKNGIVRYGRFQGQPYIFLNFGNYRLRSFYIVIWPEVLDLFKVINKSPHVYYNQWVSVTGLISTYNGAPQIVIESPKQIELIDGESEAQERINAYSQGTSVPIQATKREEKTTFTISPPINLSPPEVDKRIDDLYSIQTGNPQTPKSEPPKGAPVQPIPTKNVQTTTQPPKVVTQTNQSDLSKRLNELYAYSATSQPQAKPSSSLQGQKPVAARPIAAPVGKKHKKGKKKKKSETILIYSVIIFFVLLLFLSLSKISLSSLNKVIAPTVTKTAVTVNTPVLVARDFYPTATKAISPTKTLTATNQRRNINTPVPSYVHGCLTGNIKVRTGPGEQYTTVDWYTKGECIDFDGISEDKEWLHVQSSVLDQQSRWIYAKWVELDYSEISLPIVYLAPSP